MICFSKKIHQLFILKCIESVLRITAICLKVKKRGKLEKMKVPTSLIYTFHVPAVNPPKKELSGNIVPGTGNVPLVPGLGIFGYFISLYVSKFFVDVDFEIVCTNFPFFSALYCVVNQNEILQNNVACVVGILF